MKLRILFLSIFGTFVFNSCSTDSNSSNSTSQNLDPNTLLPKQIMITEQLYNRFFKCNFFYNGNKIDYISYTSSYFDDQSQSLVSYSGNVNYTYNGNFINKIESDNGNTSYNFTYQNGKISTCNFVSGNLENNFNIQFQYGSNGSVTRIITYPNNPNITTPLVESLNNFSNGIPSSISCNNQQSNIQYTGTNSVYKNITGFNEVLSNMFFSDLIGCNNSNYSNPDWFTKLSPIYNYSQISIPFVNGTSYYQYNYDYNEINFPTSYEIRGSNILTSSSIEYGTIIYY